MPKTGPATTGHSPTRSKIGVAIQLLVMVGCDSDSPSWPPDSPPWLPDTPTFKTLPVQLSQIDAIIPLGLPGSGGESKNRHHLVGDPAFENIPVVAPARAVLIGGSREVGPGGDVYFGVSLRVSTNVVVTLNHLADPSARLDAVLPPVSTVIGQGSPPVSEMIVIEEGEQIGRMQPRSNEASAYAMDLVTVDEAHVNTFVNQARYLDKFNYLLGHVHGRCFEAFLDAALVPAWAALYGIGPPQPGIGCGNVSRDVPGTAAGQFFLDGPAEGRYGTQVAFADTGLDLRFNLGTVVNNSGGDAQHYFDRDAHPHPEELVVGQEHCYVENGPEARWIYLRVNAPSTSEYETLDVVAGSGGCPPSFPDGGKRYNR